jgi:hypothetical protein
VGSCSAHPAKFFSYGLLLQGMKDITEIIKSKAHSSYVKKDILERVRQIKEENSEAWGKYEDGCSCKKDPFHETHYLAFDEILHAVEWLVTQVRTIETSE